MMTVITTLMFLIGKGGMSIEAQGETLQVGMQVRGSQSQHSQGLYMRNM